MNPVIETCNIPKDPTCGQRNCRPRNLLPKGSQLDDWMLKKRHRWNSVLSEMGQGKLMGSIRCTWIPFILVTINQSYLSPLLKSYSANPPVDPKTHFNTGTVELFFVTILTTPYAYQTMFYVYPFFFVTIVSYRIFIL